jgi:hypothetical protein
MNISNPELVERLAFGVKRLQEEALTAQQQAEILRAIGSISRARFEQIQTQLKEEVNGNQA